MSLTDLWLCLHLTCMSACFKAPLALIVLQSQSQSVFVLGFLKVAPENREETLEL